MNDNYGFKLEPCPTCKERVEMYMGAHALFYISCHGDCDYLWGEDQYSDKELLAKEWNEYARKEDE